MLDQVDDALKCAALAGRQRADCRDYPKLFLHLFDAGKEVGADAVEFVDVRNTRHMMLVGLKPDGFGLHFNAANGAEDAHAAVEYGRERSTSAVKST